MDCISIIPTEGSPKFTFICTFPSSYRSTYLALSRKGWYSSLFYLPTVTVGIWPGLFIFIIFIFLHLWYFILLSSRPHPFCASWVYGVIFSDTISLCSHIFIYSPHSFRPIILEYCLCWVVLLGVLLEALNMSLYLWCVFSGYALTEILLGAYVALPFFLAFGFLLSSFH